MPVTSRTLRLQQQIAGDIARINNDHTRALVAAWADAWDEVAPDLTALLIEMLVDGDRITRRQLLRSTRLSRVLAVIADDLGALAHLTGVTITADLQQVIDIAGGAQASIVDSQLPPGAADLVDIDAWSRIDRDQIAAIVQRTTEQITSLTNPLSADAYQVVRRELIRGVAAGSNPRETAYRIVRRAEQGFNGGLNRALTIARTETLDAYRTAAQLGQAQHADVLAGWVWLADLTGRVCPACLSQHGSHHKLTDPGPLGHQNCRCSRMPEVRSWAELGFDVPEPPSLIPDGQAWFDALPDGEQQAILGPTRLAAYRDGRYPMSAWSTRRETDGWRDSYVVSPAPRQSGGRRSLTAA